MKDLPPLLSTEQLSRIIPAPVTPEQLESIFQQLKKTLLEYALSAEMHRHRSQPHTALLTANAGQPLTPPQWQAPAPRAAVSGLQHAREGDVRPPPITALGGREGHPSLNVNDKITAMYAGGMSVREIQSALHKLGAAEVSPDLISRTAEEVMAEFPAWQVRPLEAMYPIVFFDMLPVKIQQAAGVCPKAMYFALGILPDGSRNILGLWVGSTESTAFWTEMLNGLKARGVQDILIAVTDGIQAAADALGAVYPTATLQTCIVHLIRSSLDYVRWKERKALATAIKPIYMAADAQAAQAALRTFAAGPWGTKFPTVPNAWAKAWPRVTPFFLFPAEIRRVIYTTNAIENVNEQLRKAIKARGHFPDDGAALKLTWLALTYITEDWGRAANHWKAAMNQFAILYGERFTRAVS